MTSIVIEGLDEAVLIRLKRRAALKGRTLEDELRRILTEAAHPDLTTLRTRAAAMRRRLADRPQSDSAELIREDRDR